MSKQCEITYGQGVVDKFRTEIVRLQGLIADATLCAFAIAESENYNDPKVPFVDAREILRRLQG